MPTWSPRLLRLIPSLACLLEAVRTDRRHRARATFGALAAAVLLSTAAPAQAAVSFSNGTLSGETSARTTSLLWGPDGRLYVAQQNGVIKAYTVSCGGASSYPVTATETITLVSQMPNRNDDGSLTATPTTARADNLSVSALPWVSPAPLPRPPSGGVKLALTRCRRHA